MKKKTKNKDNIIFSIISKLIFDKDNNLKKNDFIEISLNFQHQIYEIINKENILYKINDQLIEGVDLIKKELKKENIIFKLFKEDILSHGSLWKDSFKNTSDSNDLLSSDDYYSQGFYYFQKMDYQKTIIYYSKAIEINPSHIYAYYNRGNTYLELKEYQKALSDYNKVIKIKPYFSLAYTKRDLTLKLYNNSQF